MLIADLRQVSKSYPGAEGQAPLSVLREVDFQLEEGASAAIVGPSGCGKSTLLNLLGTLDQADGGTLQLCGENVANWKAEQLAAFRAQNLGFIFQLHHLLPQCSALENVLTPTLALSKSLRQTVHAQETAPARAERLLRHVGLGERLHAMPSQLSGGERQRVAVVRALINRPRLLLADEPTGALDEKNAVLLTDLLVQLQKEEKVSLVLVTHHRAQAERMERVYEMHDGKMTETTRL